MYQIKTRKQFAFFFVVLSFHWSSSSLAAQETLPDSPAGKCLSGLLESINSDDESTRDAFLSSGFEKADEKTLKKRQMQTQMVRSQLGKLTVKKIVNSSDHSIAVSCDTSNGIEVVLSIKTNDQDPYKIKSIELGMGGTEEPEEDLPLEANAKSDSIESLASELRSKYVYPKVGERMASQLEKNQENGKYDEVSDVREFAKMLTEELREICNDKHLRVRAGSPRRVNRGPGRSSIDNHGFAKVEILPGGIGYLKFNFFSGDEDAKETAAAAMKFLANSKTLIFDLRQNGGGSPEMIAFLSSYLFDEPVHLNSFYNRPTNTTTESWTQAEVPGKKFSPDTQVFVLTSSYTFSGAEEFSYNLKNLKRGTIVGETTGGGAHPVMPVVVGKRLHITMPFARAINPITKTNWEGVGVKPHVDVESALALEKAIELARQNESESSTKNSTQTKSTISPNVNVEELADKAAQLMAQGSYNEAAQVFEKVIQTAPDQGQAWFSYGFCLHSSGELDKAIEIHKKAAEFERFAGIATYNLACAYSLKNQTDDACAALEKAVELGFGDIDQIESDSDLDNIRKDNRFLRLIQKLK